MVLLCLLSSAHGHFDDGSGVARMKNDLAVLTKRSISDIIIIEPIKIHEVIIMGVGSWIVAILVFIVAAVLMVLAVRHFMEQGYLLNNAYIYASNEERASMNKMPYYKTIGFVFR